jgi:hypothetical protein
MTNNIDKILEAERSIEMMAAELSRMKQAADLLNTAQDQVDALLSASGAIINQAGKFAGEGAKIIKRLQAMDLESRLGEVRQQSAETQALMSRQHERLNETLERLKERNSEVVQASEVLKEEVTQAVQGIGEKLSSQVERTQADLQKTLSASQQNVQQMIEQAQRMHVEQHAHARKSQQQLLILVGINLTLLTVLLVLMLIR